MSHFFSIMLTLALIGILIYVIAENQHPVQTLAWVLVIVFLPVAGLILYFLIGHRPTRKRLLPQEERQALKSHSRQSPSRRQPEELPPPYRRLATLMQEMNLAYPLSGNAVKPYFGFYAMLDDLLSDLEQARDHIHFQFFKFEDDPVGNRVADLLIRKAAEGTVVRVQYDDLANFTRKKFYRRLKKAGILVEPFIAVTLPALSADTNFRNHRKVVVIDGRIGYLGGMNIARRYGDGLPWGVWRDTHLRVEGPAVSELQTSFLSDWRFSSGELLDEARYYPALPACGHTLMQIVTSGPMDNWNAAMQGLVQLLSEARDYVYIQSPYFIPTSSVTLALKNAALSGVDVQVMIPWRGDLGSLVSLASKSYLSEILAAGVKVRFYRKGFLHAKTIVADDAFVSIGSTNVDVRSYTLDFEIDAYMFSPEMAMRQKEAFLKDCADTELVDPVRWASRPWLQKMKESLARLLSPLL